MFVPSKIYIFKLEKTRSDAFILFIISLSPLNHLLSVLVRHFYANLPPWLKNYHTKTTAPMLHRCYYH